MNTTEIICSECNYKNDPRAVYCEECGAMLAAEDSAREQKAQYLSFDSGEIIDNRYEVISVIYKSEHESSYVALDRVNGDKAVWIKQRKIAEQEREEYEEQKPLFELLIKNTHKNVAHPLGMFEIGNYFFVVFENLSGDNLQKYIDTGLATISQEMILDWAIQASEGLNFLHSHNILHRDLQPAHLFITDEGVLKITGFSRISPLNNPPTDNVVTEGYSPPESYGLLGGQVDRRSDVFSLGASLYSLITGRSPRLTRENFFNYIPFTEIDSKVSPAIEQVVLKAVRKEPFERYTGADSILESLLDIRRRGIETRKEPLKALEFEIAAKSNVGKVRKINQDSYLITHLDSFDKSRHNVYELLVVADGMGGMAEGDQASSLAIRVIAQEVINQCLQVVTGADTARLFPNDIQKKSADILKQALLWANQVVYDYSREDISRHGMGTTITAGLIVNDNLCLCHAGDTRGYIFNKRQGLSQLTEDHSLVGRLVRMGQLTREEALNSPQRSGVYRALGTTGTLEIDVYQYALKAGDYLIMCSDGVWEYFPDAEFATIIYEEAKPKKIIDRFIRTALDRGAEDNATVLVLYVKEEEGQIQYEQEVAQADELGFKGIHAAAPVQHSGRRAKEEQEKRRLAEEQEKARQSFENKPEEEPASAEAVSSENLEEEISSEENIDEPLTESEQKKNSSKGSKKKQKKKKSK